MAQEILFGDALDLITGKITLVLVDALGFMLVDALGD